MTTTPEQFAAAGKANLEAVLELSQKAFEGVEKLVELNLQAGRATLAESTETAKAILSAKDAQEVLALQSSLVQPATEKVASYSRQVYEIASATQGEVAKLAEAQFAAAQAQITSLIESALKNAPAGSESAVAFVKSALSAGQNAVESAQKAAKQAQTAAEASFEQLTQTATTAAKAATTAAAPKRRTAA
ncbi:phasin family protein [Leptothrix sp. BB-4]